MVDGRHSFHSPGSHPREAEESKKKTLPPRLRRRGRGARDYFLTLLYPLTNFLAIDSGSSPYLQIRECIV